MDKKQSPSTLLPWFWIIEYLSTCKDVDPSLLNDIIQKAPDLSHNLAKNAREKVSLRCLQDIFLRVSAEEDAAAPISRTGFRNEDSCEDVVKHIMVETPLSESGIVGTQMKKWDALPFIMHKRASLPKCALLQVKDLVTSDSCKFPEALKRRSKLFYQDEHAIGNNMDTYDDAPLESRINRINLNFPSNDLQNESPSEDAPERSSSLDKAKRVLVSEAPIWQQQGNTTTHSGDDLNSNENKRRKVSSSQVVSSEDNIQHQNASVSKIVTDNFPKGGHKKDAAKKSLLTRTRGVVLDDSPFDKEPGNVRDVRRDDISSNGKDNGKTVTLIGSFEEISQQPNASFEESRQAVTNYSEQEVIHPETETEPITILRDNHSLHIEVNGKDENNNGTRKGKPIADEHIEDDEHMLHRGLLTVEPSTSNRVHTDTEEDDAIKKHYLSSSQWRVLLKSAEVADCIEKYSCVKCNKGGGQLMVCSSSSCPIVVHEACLGSNPYFDELGNFYCPFCAYTHAMSEYMEANKKSSLARKCLASFIGVEIAKQREGEPVPISRGEQNQCDEVIFTEVRGPSVDKSRPSEADISHENSRPQEKNVTSIKEIAAVDVGSVVNVNVQSNGAFNGHQDPVGMNTINMENSNIAQPELEANTVDESEIEEDTSRSGNEGTVNDSFIQPKATPDSENRAMPLCSVLHSLPNEGNPSGGKIEPKRHSGKHRASHHHGHTPGREESSGTPVARSRREVCRESYAEIISLPLCRRRKIPWTVLEEETLKEGVEKFSSDDCKSIPWKKILEFGNLAFEKGRTAVDLKDKWRNMCRKISA